jgi:hypothetical protein
MLTAYAMNLAFAFCYNVGDTHVFVLPVHLIAALLVGPGLMAVAALGQRYVGRRAAVAATAAALFLYSGVRIYRDFPALDRRGDRRPTQVLAALTAGLDDQHAILLTDLNWQIANGLSYFTKVTKPEIVDARMPDTILFAPAIVRDNRAIGRDVALTERAADDLTAAYGPLFDVSIDRRAPVSSLADVASHVPPGTRYVITVLKPGRDLPVSEDDLAHAARTLGASLPKQRSDYFALVGVAGEPPALTLDGDRPFRQSVMLNGTLVEVRMESWFPFDTIRRMGFGHVIAGRQHTLIVERGVSFVTFASDGRPIETAYASNIFAPQRRYLISPPRGPT